MTDWRYERGEGRHKHRWSNDYAGFKPTEKGPVGMCPKHITEKVATEILNQGVPYYEDDDDSAPARIFAVYRGVIYECVPTQPGVSWHGYPWRGDQKKRSLPRRIERRLEQQAEESGYGNEFRQWLKKYS